MNLRGILSRDSGAVLFLAALAAATTAAGVASQRPLLLLILNVVPPYLIFLDRVRTGRHAAALWLMVVWALFQSVAVVLAVQAAPLRAAAAIYRGTAYRDEMFRWIQTGVGAEGDWKLFLPQHAIHYGVFLLISALTAGAAGLALGVVLLNYMNFYVGSLFLADRAGEYTGRLILMGFPVWSMIRVAGFIAGAVAVAELSLAALGHLKDRPRRWPGRISYYLSLSLALVILDALLKALLAPYWRTMLVSAIVHAPVAPGS